MCLFLLLDDHLMHLIFVNEMPCKVHTQATIQKLNKAGCKQMMKGKFW